MQRSNRRTVLTLGAAACATVGGAAVFRAGRFASPIRREPDLSEAHLMQVASRDTTENKRRVLLIGNSATIASGFLDKLQTAAGNHADIARASAHGARLVQSLRISSLRNLVRTLDWDVVVLQDFSSTPLHPADRLASSVAIERFAQLAKPAKVVLFPHWPSAAGHPVYTGAFGIGYAVPDDPVDYARRAETHYRNCARRTNGTLAPVLASWTAAVAQGEMLYQKDMHHASSAGAALAAATLWTTIKSVLG